VSVLQKYFFISLIILYPYTRLVLSRYELVPAFIIAITPYLVLVLSFIIERIWPYEKAINQDKYTKRDMFLSFVNITFSVKMIDLISRHIFVALAVYTLGRHKIFQNSNELGPFWLQVVLAYFLLEFIRYWVHRMQHSLKILWRLHKVHHDVSDIRTINLLHFHPVDYIISRPLYYIAPVIVGFDIGAIFTVFSFHSVITSFNHCRSSYPNGFLNKFISTNEVHRWHHSAYLPTGRNARLGVNFGGSTILFDRLFGTYYFPEDGSAPVKMGVPGHKDPDPSIINSLLPN
jgi:sterol desaturase/sphingolipid hydroxylase (fatty acid hydroxylase superfamily)